MSYFNYCLVPKKHRHRVARAGKRHDKSIADRGASMAAPPPILSARPDPDDEPEHGGNTESFEDVLHEAETRAPKVRMISIMCDSEKLGLKSAFQSEDARQDAQRLFSAVYQLALLQNDVRARGLVPELGSGMFEVTLSPASHDHVDADTRVLKRCIRDKLNGYVQQDRQKLERGRILAIESMDVEVDTVMLALVAQNMSCLYCGATMTVHSAKKQDELQWTLDRNDNDRGHVLDNCMLACYACNISRRRQNSQMFSSGKQQIAAVVSSRLLAAAAVDVTDPC